MGSDIKANNITVSVLVPTYNRQDYLRESVESIVNQTVKPLEIIVINDGSDYNVEEFLADLAPLVRVINKSNGGKPEAVNLGVEAAKGTHIWVFDDDDIATPDYIEKCVGRLKQTNPDYVFGWHYSGVSKQGGGIEETGKRFPRFKSNTDIFVRLLEGCSIAHNAIIANKLCYQHLGGIDTSYPCSEDYEFQLRLAKRYRGEFVDTPSFYRRLHDGERGGEGFNYKAKERREKFVEQDRRFISKYLRTLALEEYGTEESGALVDEGEKRRALYLEKMYVAARVGLWKEFNDALQDLFSDSLCAKNELSATENVFIKSMLAYSDEVLMKPFYSYSNDLAGTLKKSDSAFASGVRRTLSRALLRNAHVFFKKGQFCNAWLSFRHSFCL